MSGLAYITTYYFKGAMRILHQIDISIGDHLTNFFLFRYTI